MFKRTRQAAPPAAAPAPPVSELVKQNKRKVEKSCRELQREISKLDADERTMIAELSKSAASSQIDAARVQAKNLATIRVHRTKMYQLRAQMQSVAFQMASVQSQQDMAAIMGRTVQMMTQMNEGMQIGAIQKMIMQFDKEQSNMEMTSEMMNDTMSDAIVFEVNEEADRILNEVLKIEASSVSERIGTMTPGHMTQADVQTEKTAEPRLSDMLSNLENRK